MTEQDHTKTLAQQYDCLLIDLDGTMFRGRQPTEGAVQTLAEVRSRAYFVTNNASRSADEVAAHLTDLGFTAVADDVATSAQSAARLLADQLPPDSPVLIVGTEALADEITAVGLRAVRSYDDGPAAVVQGLSQTIGWPELAEAALAIRDGALWVASNVDLTLPTERGLLPGNGSLVAALRAATGGEPQVAGKPAPGLLRDAAARGDFRAPLVVGDRLDTDIEGANAAELPSLMVLTGVNSARDAVYAKPSQRPTYIGHDLRSLHVEAGRLAVGPQPGWRVDVTDTAITVGGDGADDRDDLSIVRAVAAAVYARSDSGEVRIEAADDRARAGLQRWSLVHTD
ncbi:HAD hydrolase-like protein [Mycobacterium sp. 1165178.9]|uniref:HAD hydrolase-like protein n=1 Tax=Mycobacterium sp. 1165178.9 TaxID=1834070 RepID=UPI0007FC70E0|nr:HAD hydrolase-like protein [Mycobacterium sp. 1165178.9]OBK91573.1 HAD family hydrolase [Mycobacterium sp. 1165178.9]